MSSFQIAGTQVAQNGVETGPVATQTLKELLVATSLENEASSNINVAALCSFTFVPSDEVSNFEKLVQFCEECPSLKKSEVVQVVFPLLVHVYIYLFSRGHCEQAKTLNGKFFRFCDNSQQSKLTELFSFSSVNEMQSSALVSKFMNKKYFMRMSEGAFELLKQFLQILHTPFLLTLIQKYLAIEVYGSAPVDRQEVKKVATFVKVQSSRVEGNRQLGKRKFQKHSSLSEAALGAYRTPSSVPSSSSQAARLERNKKFKEKLALQEAMDPQPTSVAVCCVQQDHDGVCCATINTKSLQCACGFADSSVHVWPHLPSSERPHHVATPPPELCQRLIGHSGPVYGTSFNTNGSYLLSCSEDCSVRLWDLQRGVVSAVSYQGHSYPVWDVCFSPVDINFASAGMDRTVRLWTTDLTFPLRIFAGHFSHVNVVRFHPNGQYIASGSHDRTCRLWDTQNGQCVRVLSGSKSPITSVAFSPNGKFLVGGGADGSVRVWDLGSSNVLCQYPAPDIPEEADTDDYSMGAVSGLSFSQDGALLATSLRNCIRVYDARKFNPLPTPSDGDEDCVFGLSLSAKVCTNIVHHQFSHRNCLIAVTKVDTLSPPQTTESMSS